ncbi:bifunctional precorrin-2 dehydrogenase/sirohydrochlorin ferrochelatase [Alteribacillus sp. HJP-4]|uniref:precorrin-2 dehydrogenase/sirohydrochlorin ferrochelatase family protein n=1 Tax=Alteribacillus sp. HJP-4 TaxID=2775394 RepID=UPI0035CCE3D1
MFDFPVYMTIEKKKAVIIGGGTIALRKAEKLLSAQAEVIVVAPDLHQDLFSLYEKESIVWIKDICRREYFEDAFIIVSASGDKQAQAVIEAAARENQLVNGADNPSIGNIAFPATIESREVHIAVSTNGRNPALAKKLKQKISSQLPEWLNT